MGFNKKKGQNYLEEIPVRSPELSWRESGQGIVTANMVHEGIFNRPVQELQVTPRMSHVKLDRLGSFVQRQMDRNRSIINIGMLVKEGFVDQARPLHGQLAEFVKILKDDRLVTFGEQKT